MKREELDYSRAGSENESVKPILRRLMIPLSVILIILISVFGAAMLMQHKNQLTESSMGVLRNTSGELGTILDEQSSALGAVQEVLVLESDFLPFAR